MEIVRLGCGVCGLVCAAHVAVHPKASHLTLADRQTDGARALASRFPPDRVSVQEANGTDPAALASLLRGADVVVAAITGNGLKTIADHPEKPWPEGVPCNVEAMGEMLAEFRATAATALH